ncbi:MAG: flagellar protein FlaG [Caldimicrobium sp.]
MKVELYRNLVLDQTFSSSITTSKDIKNIESQVPEKDLTQKIELKNLDKERLKELSEEFSKFLNQFNLIAKIVYDKKYETLVVQVLRQDTLEVIKQIPPEELLELSKRLQEFVGILLQDKV